MAGRGVACTIRLVGSNAGMRGRRPSTYGTPSWLCLAAARATAGAVARAQSAGSQATSAVVGVVRVGQAQGVCFGQ